MAEHPFISEVSTSKLHTALVAIQELHKPCKTLSGIEVCDVCNAETGRPILFPCETRKLADEALGSAK